MKKKGWTIFITILIITIGILFIIYYYFEEYIT